MNDPAVLKTKLAEFTSGETAEQKLAALQVKNIAAKMPIPALEVKRYLFVTDGLWAEIRNAGTLNAQMMIDALGTFPQFDLSDQQNIAAVNAVLDGLIADTQVPSFTAESGHKAAILALEDVLQSWADQNWPGLTLQDIYNAEAMQ